MGIGGKKGEVSSDSIKAEKETESARYSKWIDHRKSWSSWIACYAIKGRWIFRVACEMKNLLSLPPTHIHPLRQLCVCDVCVYTYDVYTCVCTFACVYKRMSENHLGRYFVFHIKTGSLYCHCTRQLVCELLDILLPPPPILHRNHCITDTCCQAQLHMGSVNWSSGPQACSTVLYWLGSTNIVI